MAYSPSDPEYPKEWVYGDDERPKCTGHTPIGDPDPWDVDENQIDMFAG
jgi:hypothetical protein